MIKNHYKSYNKETNPNATFYVEDQIVVDLFPYKVKNRNLFYFRDHPKNLHPDSDEYNEYWYNFLENCIEGKWIQDEDGTWVYMTPKLFYYINYVYILNKKRKRIHPDLCDLEWIYFSYFLGLDGFSGFEDDDKYTCHRLVGRHFQSLDATLSPEERNRHKLSPIEYEKIPKSCYNKEGELKEYVHPWHYLTRTYLIDDPRDRPLGRALYDNQRRNTIILGARGIRKSFSVYMGDYLHEWTFNGIRSMDNIGDINNPLLFAMTSGKADPLDRTIKNIRGFYDSQPGKYKYEDGEQSDYMGPFYKNYQGKLGVGGQFQHVVKGVNNTIDLWGSTCQFSVLTPNNTRVSAGDRFRRIYIEEVGFIPYIEEVFTSNVDSVKLEGDHVGSWIATGTGGSMEDIKGSKKIFENPIPYDVFEIPNYWKNPDKRISLFIPAQYQKRDYDDGNGFIMLKEATEAILKERKLWSETLDSNSVSEKIMYNPIIPDEMLIPNAQSVLPKKEAQLRLSDIESQDIDKRFTNVGSLVYDKSHPQGVRFDKDLSRKLSPIIEYNVDFAKQDRSGAFLMYESPPNGIIPDNMYWVIYDPAAKSGEGTSMHSVLVYKHFLSKDGKNFRDTFVAEWIGRYPTLDENYDMVIRIARYYNARIYPETNVAGFVDWCRTNKYHSLLQPDNYRLKREINPNSRRGHYKVGFQMDSRTKWWALQRLNDWLIEVKSRDPETGMPESRNIDYIYSKRLLNEIIYYNESDNFDHISSALGAMILINDLEAYKPKSEDEILENSPVVRYADVKSKRRTSSFMKF